jgi:site-specific DNA recombinase
MSKHDSNRSAVIYARVSTPDQEREGFSIPAQLELLRSYAGANGFAIGREFVDVETAKAAGRTGFGEMIAYLKANPSCRAILVEKTDRLYRNLRDWVTIDEIGINVHFVKESVVLTQDSRSHEKFMHGIKVLMAKNYIDNLSEEVRKGLHQKAREGMWPTVAPIGYLNVLGAGGKKTIVLDPALAPAVRRLFERYATGRYALKEIAKLARADGLVYRKSGASIPTSTVHRILRKQVYSGNFDTTACSITGPTSR